MMIRQLHPNDVLFGRGPKICSHAGNVRFHRLVHQYQAEYHASRKADKPHLVAQVIHQVETLHPPGRFVEEKGSNYVVLDSRSVYVKVSQAFRDKKTCLVLDVALLEMGMVEEDAAQEEQEEGGEDEEQGGGGLEVVVEYLEDEVAEVVVVQEEEEEEEHASIRANTRESDIGRKNNNNNNNKGQEVASNKRLMAVVTDSESESEEPKEDNPSTDNVHGSTRSSSKKRKDSSRSDVDIDALLRLNKKKWPCTIPTTKQQEAIEERECGTERTNSCCARDYDYAAAGSFEQGLPPSFSFPMVEGSGRRQVAAAAAAVDLHVPVSWPGRWGFGPFSGKHHSPDECGENRHTLVVDSETNSEKCTTWSTDDNDGNEDDESSVDRLHSEDDENNNNKN